MNERGPSPHEQELSDPTLAWVNTFLKAIDDMESPEYQEVNRVQQEFIDKGYNNQVYEKLLKKALPPLEELRSTDKEKYIGAMLALCAANFIAGFKEGNAKAQDENKLNSLL